MSLVLGPVTVLARPPSWPRAVLAFPLSVLVAGTTVLWWLVGLATVTCALRYDASSAPLAPMTLRLGDGVTSASVSLGLQSRPDRMLFGTVLGATLLLTLPFFTRVCVAGRARLLTPRGSELHRLERDLHDGPQQRLVRLAMDLGRAEHRLDADPDGARAVLAEAITQTREALDELRALSRGIAPPILVDRGLEEAVAALARRSPVPVTLTLDVPPEPAPGTAATVYFVLAEALANVAKHSAAEHCHADVRWRGGVVRVRVTDDGVGGAVAGNGLDGLRRRLAPVGGRVRLTSPPGGPTTLDARWRG